MAYRLLVSIEVIEFIERLPVKTREAIRSAIHSIGRDPLGRSDALDRDATGRRMQDWRRCHPSIVWAVFSQLAP